MDERLKGVVIRSLRITAEEFRDDLAAGDVPQWDSLGHLNLLMAVEKEFGISFDVADAIDIESLADLEDMVRKYLAMGTGG